MIKEENQTIYRCEYCTMVSKSAAAMFSHELSCRKNPHNDILCLKCKYCENVDIVGDDFSQCRYCCMDDLDDSLFSKAYICDGCHGYGSDKTTNRVYRCAVDGKMMYDKDIVRQGRDKLDEVSKICKCSMVSKAEGCNNFIKK